MAYIDHEQVIQYHELGWSVEQICEETGYDELTVRRIIRQLRDQE